jgi:predicted CopG family antitoxin
VISLKKYVTISIPADVKKVLEEAKGREEWGVFLLNLYRDAKRLKSESAFKELTSILTEEDLKAMMESSKEFRGRFKLR